MKNTQLQNDLLAKTAASERGDIARLGKHIFFTDKGIGRLLALSGSKTSEVVLRRTQIITAYAFHGNRYTQASESFACHSFAFAATLAHRRAGQAMLDKLNIRVSPLSK